MVLRMFLKCHSMSDLEKKDVDTLGVELHPFVLYINRGPSHSRCRTQPSGRSLGPMRWLLLQSQRAIIVFDGASEVTYKDVPNRHSDAVCVCVKTSPLYCVLTKWMLRQERDGKNLCQK